jgi:hypothetical protein
MTIDEVISRSKLLSKAIKLGIIHHSGNGSYRIPSLAIYLTEYSGDVWSHEKSCWVPITSVKQVEAAFIHTLKTRE